MKRIALLAAAFLAATATLTASDPPSGKKEVGIFYFVWMGQHPSEQTGNYDITKLLAEHPDDLYATKGTPLSPLHKYHFWS